MSSVDPVADSSGGNGDARRCENGKKSQEGLKSRVTGNAGGESKTSIATELWKGNVHNEGDAHYHFYPEKQKDQTRKEDSQTDDETSGKVKVTISGKRSEPMPPLEMLPVLIKDGNISVTGHYDQSNIMTKASCNNGIIVKLEANIKPTEMRECICRTLWTLDGSSIDDITTTLSVSHQILFELKERIQRLYDSVLRRVGQGCLVLEFGHYTIEAAQRMVEDKDNVLQEIREVALEKLCMPITDVALTDVALTEELDEIAPLPTSSARRKKTYEPSEGESAGYHSMSSHSSRSVKEELETEINLEELQRDKEVTDCGVCSSLCKESDHDTDVKILACHGDASYLIHGHARNFARERLSQFKIQRSEKISEILRKVGALRNAGGGALFLHVSGLHTGENCLPSVNEHLSLRLQEILSPGELFSDIYEINKFGDRDNVIKLAVTHSTKFIIVETCSKTPIGDSIMNTSPEELHFTLFGKRAISNRPAVLRGTADIQEKRIDVAFKAFCGTGHTQSTLPGYCFNTLRLNSYISAFAKNASGGSVFVGVHGGEHMQDIRLEGIPEDVIGNISTFKEAVQDMIASSMLVVNNINHKEPYDMKELVEVGVHKVEGASCVIIEFAVRPVNGCVFTDKNGPIAYKLNGAGKLIRVTVKEYIERLKTLT